MHWRALPLLILRANLGLSWTGGDFGANVGIEHIASTSFAGTGSGLASFNPVAIQFTYDTPWNGKVTVGARNVFDRDPPLNDAFSITRTTATSCMTFTGAYRTFVTSRTCKVRQGKRNKKAMEARKRPAQAGLFFVWRSGGFSRSIAIGPGALRWPCLISSGKMPQ